MICGSQQVMVIYNLARWLNLISFKYVILIPLNLCLRLFFCAKQNGLLVIERAGKCQENSLAVTDIAAIYTVFIQLR